MSRWLTPRRPAVQCSARDKHEWPPVVTAQANWDVIYIRALEGLEDIGIAGSLDDALARVQSFIDRIAGVRLS